MTSNTRLIQETVLAALIPVVALVVALEKRGILAMPDLYEELAMMELSAAASHLPHAQTMSEVAGVAKHLLVSAAAHVQVASKEQGVGNGGAASPSGWT